MGDVKHHWPEDCPTSFKPVKMKAFPVAVGPCKIYQRTTILRLARCVPICMCCCNGHRSDGGSWRDCYIKLFSDSTLKIFSGSNSNSELVTRMVLKHLYREILFGSELQIVADRPDAPQTFDYTWDSVLAIPDEPYCNGNIVWLDFTRQETLHKWLVAICSTLPVKQLRGDGRMRCVLERQKSGEQLAESVSDSLGLRSCIDTFFRRKQITGKNKKKIPCLIAMSKTSLPDERELLRSNTATSSDV